MISLNEKDYLLDCQGDVCTNDIVTFLKEVWIGGEICGTVRLYGKILSEKYLSSGRHEFNIILYNGVSLILRGRDFYKYEVKRLKWKNESQRDKMLRDKHERGKITRRLINERTNRENDAIRDEGSRSIQQRRAS